MNAYDSYIIGSETKFVESYEETLTATALHLTQDMQNARPFSSRFVAAVVLEVIKKHGELKDFEVIPVTVTISLARKGAVNANT